VLISHNRTFQLGSNGDYAHIYFMKNKMRFARKFNPMNTIFEDFATVIILRADHSGRSVQDINYLRSLEHLNCGFESHSSYGCLSVRLFYVCVVLCVFNGSAKD
jgi:hypothetical protein